VWSTPCTMRRGAQISWFDIKTKVDGLSVSFYLLCLVFFVVQYSCSLIFSASSVQYSLFSTFLSLVFNIFHCSIFVFLVRFTFTCHIQ
jgi:hypothetical protein